MLDLYKSVGKQPAGIASLSPLKVRLVAFMVVMFFTLLLFPGEAHARRGRKVALVNWGQKTTMIQEPDIGYIYERVGLFWVFEIWSWGGEYCILREDSYTPLTRDEVSALTGIPVADVKPPTSYRYPLGLIALGVLAVIGVVKAALQPRDPTENHQAWDTVPKNPSPVGMPVSTAPTKQTTPEGPGLFAAAPPSGT